MSIVVISPMSLTMQQQGFYRQPLSESWMVEVMPHHPTMVRSVVGTTGVTGLSEDDEDGAGFATFGFSWLTETASVTAFSSITNSRDVLLVVAVERNRPYRKKKRRYNIITTHARLVS
jgi:hypothetical protein